MAKDVSGDSPFPLGFALFVMILLWLVGGTILFHGFYAHDPSGAGQFGDMFGVLNTLFSAMAFGALFYSIQLQRRELRETREEFVQQNQSLKIQSFENTFFNLLQSQIELVKLIDLHGKDKKVVATGRDCFKRYRKQLDRLLDFYIAVEMRERQNIRPGANVRDRELGDQYRKHVEIPLETAIQKYLELYKKHQADLGHYFRNLFHIVKLIDSSDVITDKKKYIRFVRAQLSAYELVLLFYNCLSENGRKEFYPLIEKYNLLKNMNWDLLINSKHAAAYPSLNYRDASAKE